MRLALLAVVCLIALASIVDGQTYTTPDGHEFSVSVKADKPTIMLGEATYLSWEVKNHSDTLLSFGDGGDYRNYLGRPENYKVTVVRDDGKSVPQPEVLYSMGGLLTSQPVPVNGSYVRKLFVPHWATFEEPGTYIVTVTRGLGISGTDKEPTFRRSTEDGSRFITTKATTILTVIKTDSERLGAIIRETGTRMLNASEGARDAVLGKAYERIGKKAEALSSYERAIVLGESFRKELTGFLGDSHDDDLKKLAAAIQRLK